MNIGILGAGNVGGSLGKGLAEVGHNVLFGVRDAEAGKVRALLAKIEGEASAASVEEAARFGEVVIITIPFQAAEKVLPGLAEALRGKTIIDTTNAINWDNGPVPALETSAAGRFAALLPGSHIVKAFNTIGAEHMSQPDFRGEAAGMFICGENAEAKESVRHLTTGLGFEVYDAGPLRNARLLEHLAALWIHMATVGGLGRDIAFKLLHK